MPMPTSAPRPQLRVVCIRHGQTAWNAERRILGRTDLPLDATGLAQADALASAWPSGWQIGAMVSSPLARARATAAPLAAAAKVDLVLDEGLVEMDQGTLEGLPAELLARDHAALLAAWRDDPGAVTLPGGEAMLEVQRRGLATLRRLAAEHAEAGTLVIVTHQLLLSAVLCGLADEPLRRWRAWSHRNTAWCQIAWGDPPQVVEHDVAPHLGHATH